jgi:hypothetical protein
VAKIACCYPRHHQRSSASIQENVCAHLMETLILWKRRRLNAPPLYPLLLLHSSPLRQSEIHRPHFIRRPRFIRRTEAERKETPNNA